VRPWHPRSTDVHGRTAIRALAHETEGGEIECIAA